MVDISTIREPIEIWKFAYTDSSEDLIKFLRSDQKIDALWRETLALYFEGKLKPSSQSRGNPGDIRSAFEKIIYPNQSDILESVVQKYKRIAKRLGRTNIYKKSDTLIDSLAKRYGPLYHTPKATDSDHHLEEYRTKLHNELRRGKTKEKEVLAQHHTTIEVIDKIDNFQFQDTVKLAGEIEAYQKWLIKEKIKNRYMVNQVEKLHRVQKHLEIKQKESRI